MEKNIIVTSGDLKNDDRNHSERLPTIKSAQLFKKKPVNRNMIYSVMYWKKLKEKELNN